MQRLLSVIYLLISFFIASAIFCSVSSAENYFPFQPGEKMHFVLKYGVIPAGEATLEVREMNEMQGIEAYHFVLTARSNPFVDMFFKVRDRIDSYADAAMNHSLYYRKDQNEGKTRRDIRVNFDWDEKQSTYVNFDTEPKVISLLPRTFDPLAIFYYSRLLDLEKEKIFEHPVTDGEKNMMGVLRVIGRETISVPAGTYETLVLEPDLKKVDGVFFKDERAKIKIWLSDDERRLLVKMKSRVKVGSFVAELVTVEGHDESIKVSSLRNSE
ncbi:MAG: DUF3108 domain-containing protein [Deltaproteobacteria bacterium]|jgi:hypothetical protein|nr:DUF3108 domain-containing protein [Deltaproteobacteria bacterium]